MRTIIAGSRDCADISLIGQAIKDSGFRITHVVSGMCNCEDISSVIMGNGVGVDALGIRWAFKSGIPWYGFKADWKAHGRAAGPIRNSQMADNADALIALWDGKSPGTKNMIETARKKGLKVYVKIYQP